MDGRLEMWGQWMRATGATDKTISTRLNGIHALCTHAGDMDPVSLTTIDIIAWLADCNTQWTRRTYATTARAWHKWLVEQGLRTDDPTAVIPTVPQPDGVARPAATEAVHDVLGHSGRKTRAYITLATYEGLRCFEIAKLRTSRWRRMKGLGVSRSRSFGVRTSRMAGCWSRGRAAGRPPFLSIRR